MFKIRLTKVLNLLIEFAYLGAIFFVPLYFSIVPRTVNVFELNKAVLLRIFVLIFVSLLFINILFQKHGFTDFFRFIKRSRKYFIIPAIYFVSLGIQTFISMVPRNSFWGSYDFQLGFYNYFYIFIFFFGLLYIVKTEEQKQRIIYTIFFSSVFVCVYGLMQIFRLDPLQWAEDSSHRIFSSIGQPNFLASYLLLCIPVSAYLFYKSKNKFFKVLALGGILGQLVCLYFTYSRAGYLGLVAGFFTFLLIYLGVSRSWEFSKIFATKKQKIFVIVAIVFMLVIGGGIVFKQKARLADIVNFHGGSVASRSDYYRAAGKAFGKKPLFGYGLANQKEVYSAYYQRDWAINDSVNALPAQAHNIILDCLLQGGIIGLAFWLMINAYFLYLVIKNIKEKRAEELSWALLSAWLAYSFSLFFGFSILVTEFYFWVFLALLILPNIFDVEEKNEYINRAENKKAVIIRFLISILLLTGLMYRLNFELKIIIADHYFYQIESSLNQGKYYEAFSLYDWLKILGVDMTNYHMQMGEALAQMIDKNETAVWALGAKRLLFPKFIESIPDDSYSTICARAKIYAAMSLDDKKDFHGDAEKEFEKCLQKGENIPGNYREYGRYYYGKGDDDKALVYLKKAEELLPSLNNPDINLDHRSKIEHELYLIDTVYGDVFFEKKDFSQAEIYYRRAAALNPSANAKKKIADVFYARHDLEGTIKIIKEIKAENQPYYFWSYLLAELYREKMDWTTAKAYAEEALGLQAKDESTIKLLKEIDQHTGLNNQ